MVSLVTVVVFAGVGLAYVGKGLIKSVSSFSLSFPLSFPLSLPTSLPFSFDSSLQAELAPVGGLVYHFVKEVVRGNFHITNNHGLLAPVVIGVVGGLSHFFILFCFLLSSFMSSKNSLGCYLLGMIRVGFFLAGSAAGAAITSMVFSVIGDYLGSFANTIQYAFLLPLSPPHPTLLPPPSS